MKQLEFPFWAEFERCQLRRNIFAALARVFGEVQLDDACRCQCGGKVRCVVNGWAIFWCDRCGWYADEKWLLEGYDDQGESNAEKRAKLRTSEITLSAQPQPVLAAGGKQDGAFP